MVTKEEISKINTPTKLGKLTGERTKVTLKGEEFVVPPLTLKELPLVIKFQYATEGDAQAGCLLDLVSATIENMFPDATEAERDSISLEYLEPLAAAILKANKLGKEDSVPLARPPVESPESAPVRKRRKK